MKTNVQEPDSVPPINLGMELPRPPKLHFYPNSEFFRTYKKMGYQVKVTQISQTKVQAKVTPVKVEEGSPTRSATGIGGFQTAKDFCYEAAVQAAFENAVARLGVSIDL